MEAFARQREEDIDPLGYQVDPSSFVVLEKTVQGSLEDKSIAAGSIIDWSNDRGIYGLSPVPKLKIISIEHEHRFKQHISKPLNDAIYSAFHIGSWMKNLAFNQNRGFFHVRPKDREDIETFLFSTGYGMVAWSFCRTTSLTRGIFLGWGTRWQDLGYRLFPYNDSASHPLLLGLVCAQWVIFEADRSIYRQLNVLDGVEAATGYHSTQYAMMTRHGSHDQQPEDLSELSKRLADVSITIAQATGYIKIAKRVIQSLVDDPWKLRQVQAPVWDDVAQVARCVLAEVTEEETWDDAKQIRMANQMTVIFNLITREDTAASIKLAEAAKRDSSSMKTIAFMTMFFLPATFFSTVFAMPGLNLEQAPTFKTYLALSITTTVAIILAWAVITQRQVLRDMLLDLSNRRGKSSPNARRIAGEGASRSNQTGPIMRGRGNKQRE